MALTRSRPLRPDWRPLCEIPTRKRRRSWLSGSPQSLSPRSFWNATSRVVLNDRSALDGAVRGTGFLSASLGGMEPLLSVRRPIGWAPVSMLLDIWRC